MIRTFKFLAFALVGLAIACYAIADSRLVFGAIMLFLGAVGVALTELRAGRALPRPIILGLVALALANAAYAASSGRLSVSAFSEFVTYLQVIKLFDRRRSRDYAQLLSLATFQIIGAMLTSNALLVGFLLLLFVPGITLCAALQQVFAAADESRAPEHARGRGARARRDLLAVSAICTIAALLGGAAAFLFVPRGLGAQRMGEWGNVSLGQTTAFTDSVTLGVGGLISESQAEVLDLAVTNRLGQSIGSADRIFYLRGAVLDTYDDGRWTLGTDRTFTRQHVIENVAANVGGRRPSDADISAKITIRNASERVGYIFTIWRPNQIILHDPGGFIELGPHGIIRRDSPTGKYEYTIRCDTNGRGPERTAEPARERSAYSPRIQALADDVLTAAGIDPDPATRPPESDEQAARALESYLRLNYGYTLEITAAPAGRDATEYFLFTSREGHCEYFASALASMCRAVGIEARVVTGYVAAEFIEGASQYVVRESNAHAWVEAPLSRSRWTTLDATPPADLTRIHKPALGPLARVRRAFDSIELAWIHGVVGFDEKSRAAVLGSRPVNPRRIEERMADFNLRMSVGGLSLAARAARNALLTFAGVALIGLGLSVVVSTLRTRWRVMRAIRAARRVDPTIGVPVQDAGLFARLQALLARKGRPRPVWMGALDHANQVAAEDPAAAPATDLVRLYYAARFGRKTIDAAETTRARRALDALRRTMARRPSPRRTRVRKPPSDRS